MTIARERRKGFHSVDGLTHAFPLSMKTTLTFPLSSMLIMNKACSQTATDYQATIQLALKCYNHDRFSGEYNYLFIYLLSK